MRQEKTDLGKFFKKCVCLGRYWSISWNWQVGRKGTRLALGISAFSRVEPLMGVPRHVSKFQNTKKETWLIQLWPQMHAGIGLPKSEGESRSTTIGTVGHCLVSGWAGKPPQESCCLNNLTPENSTFFLYYLLMSQDETFHSKL